MTAEMTKIVRESLPAAGVTAAILTGAACGPAIGQVTVSPTGVVVGTFVREGGPIGPNGQQPKEARLPGELKFISPGNHVVKVKIGKNGRFSVRLLPGTYSVSGRTPDIEQTPANGTRPGLELPCSSPLPVKVTRGNTSKITVTCVVPQALLTPKCCSPSEDRPTRTASPSTPIVDPNNGT